MGWPAHGASLDAARFPPGPGQQQLRRPHRASHLALGATARLITGSGTEMDVMASLHKGRVPRGSHWVRFQSKRHTGRRSQRLCVGAAG